MGEQLGIWRKLRQLTAAQVADRAGISRYTVMRLENGEGASLENLLRVARALGVLDLLAAALDRGSSPAEMRELANAVSGSSFYLLQEMGHYAPYEQPRLVGALLRRFADENTPE